jgi:hypothetical protein
MGGIQVLDPKIIRLSSSFAFVPIKKIFVFLYEFQVDRLFFLFATSLIDQ